MQHILAGERREARSCGHVVHEGCVRRCAEVKHIPCSSDVRDLSCNMYDNGMASHAHPTSREGARPSLCGVAGEFGVHKECIASTRCRIDSHTCGGWRRRAGTATAPPAASSISLKLWRNERHTARHAMLMRRTGMRTRLGICAAPLPPPCALPACSCGCTLIGEAAHRARALANM